MTDDAATGNRYDAFISYSRSAYATIGEALQDQLQRFAKPWYQRRALRVFRDATTLTPHAPLPTALETAIHESRYFILLASPETAASPWVQREIAHWRERNGTDRLLLVLTGGTLTWSDADGDFDRDQSSALPEQLFGAFPAEPLYLDLRDVPGSPSAAKQDPVLQDAVATLAAVIHGRSKDDLVGEDLVQHRRSLRLARGAVALLSLLAIAATFASFVAVKQRDLAEARERQARADQLAANASRLLVEQPEDLELATLLAIESVRRDPDGNGQRVLSETTGLLPARVAESFGEGVEVLAFSPDKRWLARGDEQMGVMIWNLESDQLAQLSTPSEIQQQLQVRDLAFSADSRWLAIASGGPNARVYDLPDGEHEWVFEHGDTVMTVAFDPAGERLATGAKDGRFRVWDVATQTLVLDEAMTGDDVRVVGFSPDGEFVGAVASNGPIRLFRTSDWRPVELEAVAPGYGLAMGFSPDGRLFAVTRGNRAVAWSLEDGKIVANIGHSDYTGDVKMAGGPLIGALAFSPDGELLVTSGRDRTTRFWQTRSGEEVLRLTHRSLVDQVAVSDDGRLVATGGFDMAQLWRLPEGDEVLRVAPTGGSDAVALTADGTRIATGGPQSSIRVMGTASAARARQYTHDDDIVALACHPDRPLIAAADDGNDVTIWNAGTDARVAGTNQFNVDRLRFLSNGALAISAQTGLHVLETDGASRLLSPPNAYDHALHDDFVAVRRRGGDILVWPAAGDRPPIEIDTQAVADIPFNENGRILLSISMQERGGLAHLWDVQTGEELWKVPLRSTFGPLLAADATGKRLAVAVQRELRVVDRQGGDRTLELPGVARAVVFANASTRLAVLLDQAIELYDAADLDAAPLRIRRDGTIRHVAFNPARTIIAVTTGNDVSVWEATTGKRLADWSTDARVSRLCFLAGDEAIVTGDDANHVTVRPWRMTDLVAAACERLTRNLTEREWDAYLPGVPYEATCPSLTPLSREQLVREMFPE